MNTTNSIKLEITIPAAIAAVPGLTLQERAALTYVHQHPRCRNSTLARHLGMMERGVEALLHRMRQLGHIWSVGRGRARRIELSFPVELRTECGVQQNEESHTNCGVEQSTVAMVKCEPSTQEFAELHLALAENCVEQGLYKAARGHLEMIRARMVRDESLTPEMKTNLLTYHVVVENQYFAFQAGAEIAGKLPGKQQKELALTLCRASPEKLARIRKLVEANGKLENALEILALPPSKAET